MEKPKRFKEIFRGECHKDVYDADEIDKWIEQEIVSSLEKGKKIGRAEIEKELMCELRDPSGTIWEHANRLQYENDELKKKLSGIEENLSEKNISDLIKKHHVFVVFNTDDQSIVVVPVGDLTKAIRESVMGKG